MATILYSDGRRETKAPANGVNWTLEEIQAIIGGYMEVVTTTDGRWLVLDEEGKIKHKPVNLSATALYLHGGHQAIVGDVMLIDTFLELDGPEDPDEG